MEIILDTTGDICPIPIVRLGKQMRACIRGSIVLLISDDPGVEEDVRAWCKANKHEILEIQKEGGVYSCKIKKN